MQVNNNNPINKIYTDMAKQPAKKPAEEEKKIITQDTDAKRLPDPEGKGKLFDEVV